MTANVRALVISNVLLVATIVCLLFIAFPRSADATSVKVQRGTIEFRSTIPCDRQGPFITESKRQGDFEVVASEEGFLSSVPIVSGVTTETTTIPVPGSFVPKTVVTRVNATTERLAAFDLYGCTASVVIGVR